MRKKEDVWDYPRPPRVENVPEKVRVRFAERWIVDTNRSLRVLETSHPPCYYIPVIDILPGLLIPSERKTYCEFKGVASYWNLVSGTAKVLNAAWSYSDPSPGFAGLQGYVSFYASKVAECWVGDEKVTPQASDFYGGWITTWITGAMKGPPGTEGW